MRCNRDCRNLSENNSHQQRMFFWPSIIFTEERYNELVSGRTNDQALGSADIKKFATRKIPSVAEKGCIAGGSNPESKSIRHSPGGNSETDSQEKFPPVEVEPICKDKLTIKFTVSKPNPDFK